MKISAMMAVLAMMTKVTVAIINCNDCNIAINE